MQDDVGDDLQLSWVELSPSEASGSARNKRSMRKSTKKARGAFRECPGAAGDHAVDLNGDVFEAVVPDEVLVPATPHRPLSPVLGAETCRVWNPYCSRRCWFPQE
mgnify:CR=1 FL=1